MKVGIDIVCLDEITKKENLERFLNKYFSESEQQYIKIKQKKEQTIAGMFAAKEAFLKALEIGIGTIKLSDVEILHKENGAPYINKNNIICKTLLDFGFTSVEISISHANNYATAICNLY